MSEKTQSLKPPLGTPPPAAPPPQDATPAKPKRQRRKKSTVTTPATTVETETPAKPKVFDLVGADERRLLRSVSRDACKDLQARIAAATGEKTRIVDASPFARPGD